MDEVEVPRFNSVSEMHRWLFATAPNIHTGIERLRGLTLRFGQLSRVTGRPVDISDLLKTLDETERRTDLFHRLFAPRGWALSHSIQNSGMYLVVGAALDRDLISESQADQWLTDSLRKNDEVERLLNFLAVAPLRGLWAWLPPASDTAVAMRAGLNLPAALGWMTVAEGIWKEMQPLVGRERPSQFFTRSSEIQHLTESLTWTRESMAAVHQLLIERSDDIFVEPRDSAPTNRHGLVHGNVSGFVEPHHVYKAYTLVEVVVEEAKAVIPLVDDSNIELPPWR